MKKFLLFTLCTLISLVIIFSLTACGLFGGTEGNTEEDEKAQIYSKINNISGCTEYSLRISTTLDGSTLTSGYNVQKKSDGNTKINYRYQEKNKFEITEGKIIVPNSYITTKSGSITINQNGTVVDSEGSNTPDVDFTFNLSFEAKEEYFFNIFLTDTTFSAKVNNPDGLFGGSFTGNNLTLTATFDSTKVTLLELDYTTKAGTLVHAALTPDSLLPLE